MHSIGPRRPTLMLGSLYVALKEAGVSEELARQAAEEAAECLRPPPTLTGPPKLLYVMLAAYVVLTAVAFWQLFTSG